MLSTKKRITRKNVVKEPDSKCAVPECTHDFTFGIRVELLTETTFFGLINSEKRNKTKLYCPFHCQYQDYVREALRKNTSIRPSKSSRKSSRVRFYQHLIFND